MNEERRRRRERRMERERRERTVLLGGLVVLWSLAAVGREAFDAFSGETSSPLRLGAAVLLTLILAVAVAMQPDR